MVAVIAFIFGSIIGSFLNVLIFRIPKEESVVFPASHCQSCNTPLKWYHNIPIFSWLFLGGKCSFCKEKISMQYPLVELTSGIIAVAVVMKYSFSVPVVFIILSFYMLLVLSLIDLKYKMVPDSINLLAIVFAVLGAWSPTGILLNLQNALLFAGGFTLLRFALSYYLTSSVYRAGLKTKTPWNKHYDRTPFIEAMGEGDIMVAATMGALLGVKLGLIAIFLSALIALPILLLAQTKSKEEQKIPYVPFLTLATFIAFLGDSFFLRFFGV